MLLLLTCSVLLTSITLLSYRDLLMELIRTLISNSCGNIRIKSRTHTLVCVGFFCSILIFENGYIIYDIIKYFSDYTYSMN